MDAEVYVNVGDRQVRFLTVDKWTFADARYAKEVLIKLGIPGGLAPAQIEAGLQMIDADCWEAVLRVSARRSGGDLGARELDGLNLLGIAREVLEAIGKAKEAGEGPPAAAGEPAGAPSGPTPDAGGAPASSS